MTSQYGVAQFFVHPLDIVTRKRTLRVLSSVFRRCRSWCERKRAVRAPSPAQPAPRVVVSSRPATPTCARADVGQQCAPTPPPFNTTSDVAFVSPLSALCIAKPHCRCSLHRQMPVAEPLHRAPRLPDATRGEKTTLRGTGACLLRGRPYVTRQDGIRDVEQVSSRATHHTPTVAATTTDTRSSTRVAR